MDTVSERDQNIIDIGNIRDFIESSDHLVQVTGAWGVLVVIAPNRPTLTAVMDMLYESEHFGKFVIHRISGTKMVVYGEKDK
jgi:hypothetical protein